MVPSVSIRRVDNQLGVTPPDSGDTLAIVGVCDAGTYAAGFYAREEDVVAEYESGPLVVAACYEISQTGRPVLVCRTEETTAGGYGAVDVDEVTGAVIVTAGSGEPRDDYEGYVEVVTGFDVGVTGGTIKTSLDDGRTLSAETSVGTDTTIELGGGVELDLSPSQTFTSVFGTDILTFSGAGYPDGTPIYVKNTGGALPPPLVAGTLYYTRDRSTNTSKLALTLAGAAIDLITDNGTGTHSTRHTLVAGDIVRVRTTAPLPSTQELDDALEKLQNNVTEFELIEICSQLEAADVAAINTRIIAMEAVGKEATFIGHFRLPEVGETEAAYKTAFDTEFGASECIDLVLCAGALEVQDSVTKRQYLRAPSIDMAAALVSVRPGQDVAHKALGARPDAVRIVDSRLNPKHHDERLFPGLDASRAATYRTWARSGARPYINNPRTLSAADSDYQFGQHSRVSVLACKIVREVLERRASGDLLVDRTTGFVIEDEAKDIDTEVNQMLDLRIVQRRNASGATFRLNRTDNILSTFTLNGSVRIIPLAYAKHFNVSAGFHNPALRIVFPEGG